MDIVTLGLTVNEILKWLSSLPILMQESFWWWHCRNRYIISLFAHLLFLIPNKLYVFVFCGLYIHKKTKVTAESLMWQWFWWLCCVLCNSGGCVCCVKCQDMWLSSRKWAALVLAEVAVRKSSLVCELCDTVPKALRGIPAAHSHLGSKILKLCSTDAGRHTFFSE